MPPDRVAFLEGVLADGAGGHLAGDDHQRDGVHVGVEFGIADTVATFDQGDASGLINGVLVDQSSDLGKFNVRKVHARIIENITMHACHPHDLSVTFQDD